MKQQIHNYASLSVLQKVLLAAVNAIQSYDYRSARDLLKEASSIDIENPEIFNLLGISYEKEGDFIKASKYYRVAYYMDQTFSAPSDNLDRVGTLFSYKSTDINLGLERITGGVSL